MQTLREAPADAEIASHRLAMRACLITKLANGLYTYMPMGLRSLRKVEAIIRDELDAAGLLEIKPTVIIPAELWRQSGRWDTMGEEMLRVKTRTGQDMVVSPTAEEAVTSIVGSVLKSYKQLPVTVYQINTKYRDEIRPRYGVMRGREFTMMDAYSFNEDDESLDKDYNKISAAYRRIFRRMGLSILSVKASTGAMGGSGSEEFMVESAIGDDTLVICGKEGCTFAANVEVANKKEGDACPVCGSPLHIKKGNELGHIFKLGDKYTKSMGITYLDANGKKSVPIMGCYGIGVDRTFASIIEEHHDERGIIWPISTAPFEAEIVAAKQDDEAKKVCEGLYKDLSALGVETLLDDRAERAGVKFADMDLLGTPIRIVVGKSLPKVEVSLRGKEDKNLVNAGIAAKAVLDMKKAAFSELLGD